MSEPVRDAVEELARSGQWRFYGSLVAKKAKRPQKVVDDELRHLVDEGLLRTLFVLVSPEGRTIETFDSPDSVPLEQTYFHELLSEPMFVEQEDVAVIYEPTTRLHASLRKAEAQATNPGKAHPTWKDRLRRRTS